MVITITADFKLLICFNVLNITYFNSVAKKIKIFLFLEESSCSWIMFWAPYCLLPQTCLFNNHETCLWFMGINKEEMNLCVNEMHHGYQYIDNDNICSMHYASMLYNFTFDCSPHMSNNLPQFFTI